MENGMLETHLAQARRHVADGERHIANQRATLARLDRKGLDTIEAKKLLKTFEELQQLHIADRDRLERELAGS